MVRAVCCGVLLFSACDPAADAPSPRGAEPDRSGGSSSGGGGGGDNDGGTALPHSSDKLDVMTPLVQTIGRFDLRDPAGPKCAWPGCSIVARFEGTRVSVRLGEIDEPWMDGAPSEWDVAIDGVWGDKLVLAPGAADYVLAKELAPGVHTVTLYKRSEAQNGTTQFLGFDFGGGTLLAPPPRKERRIEIIGDSSTSGYGVEGVGYPDADCPGSDDAARWQNFRLSFGARLGDAMGAEVFGTVHSGKGIAKNIWRPDLDTLPVLFSRVIPVDATSTWDFAGYQPDVVIVMAGANDFSIGKPRDDGPASPEAFLSAYGAFASAIRREYGHAHIFLVASPSVSDASPAKRNTRTNILSAIKTITERRNAEGDARIYWLEPARAQPSELTACGGHANPQLHERLAKELAAEIKPKLGW